MRLAVLDLGLRSFQLAVFETRSALAIAPLIRRRSWSETVRLGAGMAGHRLSGAALARGTEAVHRLLFNLAGFDPTCPVVVIATSALRTAENGPAFCDEIRRTHGFAVELLSGEGEAQLSYLGAHLHLTAPGCLAVAELGSVSLELATGSDGACDLMYSVPLGTLGLRDVYVPRERALDRAAREDVAATVRSAAADAVRAIRDRRPDRLAFTSGAAEALGALADELGFREPGEDEIGLAALTRLADVLTQFRPIELPALGIEEARSDTIAVAAIVLHTVMVLLGFDSAAISPSGRREGVVVRYVRAEQAAPDNRVHTAVT